MYVQLVGVSDTPLETSECGEGLETIQKVLSSVIRVPLELQSEIDEHLTNSTSEKEGDKISYAAREVITTVSYLLCQSSATVSGLPLYLHVRSLVSPQFQEKIYVPLPAMTLIKCGKAFSGKLNFIQDVFVMPNCRENLSKTVELCSNLFHCLCASVKSTPPKKKGKPSAPLQRLPNMDLFTTLDKPDQILDLILNTAKEELGLVPGEDIFLGLSCNASCFYVDA
ncbi:enolase 4-like [Limulus polyphemus]|uniref:phosphopyruvate hydratase n=1 Tax=Limulus polyphemus TaxID=6850 RepID=A0ABM1TJM9_LIMPO|nr:enolase 4-like [Limulus polyphemus]